MSTSYIETSIAYMQSVFKTPALAPITGQLNPHILLCLLKKICRCSQTTNLNMDPHRYLLVAFPIQHYVRFTTVLLNLPGPTPALPNLQGIFNSGQREQIKIKRTAHNTENTNIANMNKAMTKLCFDAILDAYKKNINNDLVGRTDSKFWPIFQTFLATYGPITLMDLELNIQQMKKALGSK